MLTFGQLGDLTVQVHFVQLFGSVPACVENQRLIVQPCILIDVTVQRTTEEPFLARLQIHHHQAVLVTLIPVPLHRLPCNPHAVGRVTRVRIVSHVVLRQVLMPTRT